MRLTRWLLPLGLVTATAIESVPSAHAQVSVRVKAGVRVGGPPTSAPPALRAERRPARQRGRVWVAGYWDWQNGRWTWFRGKYERVRTGKRWREPRWEQQGDTYVRAGGDWDTAPEYPDAPPPEPRAERSRNRRGYVYVAGYWDWQNGSWDWIPGKYERQRKGSRWESTRWDQRDGRWQRQDGGWRDGDGGNAPWRFDASGWSLLGEQTVDGRVDTGHIGFSQNRGKVSKLTIVVIDSDLEMLDLGITFVSGKTYNPKIRQFFREGTRTRVINLPNAEILRAVDFKFANLPGGGRAKVQVYADVK